MTSRLPDLLKRLRSYEGTEIGAARALPMELYTSQALFDLEMEQIFRKEWLCVGRSEQVQENGDYFTTEILGEPIVIVRGDDSELRALSAVCRHRYYSVVEGSGNAKQFTCPYHRWTYGLDGHLHGAPHMGEKGSVIDVEGKPCALPRFALDVWQGFIFVSLDANADALSPRLSGAEKYWRNYNMETQRIVPWVDEVWPGNWKLAMETALEGYHVSGLHADTLADFMPSRTSNFEATSDHWTLFRLATVFDGEYAVYKDFADEMGGEDATSAPQFGFFPNCAVSCAQFSSIWLTFIPIDVGHTRVIGGNLIPAGLYDQVVESEALSATLHDGVNAINVQDASAMVNLQRNARSRYAEPGLLSEKETCLLYFYRYLAKQLAVDEGTSWKPDV